MAEFPPAPSYPNYAGFLSNLIGGLPTDYRNAQQQQTQIDVSNTFKDGVPHNPDGTINYAAALQMRAKAGDPYAVDTLGPQAQTQAWQQQGMAPPALLGGSGSGGAPPAPPAAQPAPMQPPPAAAPPQAPSGAIAGTVSDGAGPPPTLAALVSGVAPDPAKNAAVTGMLAKILGVDPTAPLTPDQVERAQRIMTNLLKPGVGGPAMSPSRLEGPPDPAVAGSRAVAAPVGTPQPAATADIAARETVAYGGPQRNLTQADATAIATGNAPGTGGDAGTPFGLPPAAEAVWQRMVPAESRGQQFKPDGSVVTSPKGAVGIAQVMPDTGPEAARLAGLPWDPVRFKNDPQYNLALGRAYYAQQVRSFGSPDVAAAAYNAGPKAVLSAQAKAINRGGGYLDYLPAETRDYVDKVTAGGAQQPAGGGAPQQGGRPIFPEPSLPEPFKPGQEQQAIDELRKTALYYAQIPGNNGAARANYYNRQADAIEAWMQPKEVRQGQSFVDASGKTVYTAPYPGSTLTPAAIEDAAEVALKTGKPPQGLGRGIQGPADVRAVMNRVAELAQERHIDPSKLAEIQQGFSARSAGLRQVFQRATGLTLVENEANRLIPRVRELLPKLNHTDYPTINAAINAYERQTGDPNIVKFGISAASLATVYARVLKAGGAINRGDVEDAQKLLDQAWSKGQIDAALDQMGVELQSAKQSTDDTLSGFDLSMKDIPNAGFAPAGGASPTAGNQPQSEPRAAGGALPPGRYKWDPATGDVAPVP